MMRCTCHTIQYLLRLSSILVTLPYSDSATRPAPLEVSLHLAPPCSPHQYQEKSATQKKIERTQNKAAEKEEKDKARTLATAAKKGAKITNTMGKRMAAKLLNVRKKTKTKLSDAAAKLEDAWESEHTD